MRYHFIVTCASLALESVVHAYLLHTIYTTQKLLRKQRLIVGFKAVKLTILAYLFYLAHLIFPCIVYPIIRFRVSTSDYECTERDKHAIAMLITWTHVASPICYQLPFFGLLIQLSKITKKNDAWVETADTSINHEVDEGLYPIVLLSSPQFFSFVNRDTLISFVVKYKREFTEQ